MVSGHERIDNCLGSITSSLVGEELLIEFKKILLTQNAFKNLFGTSGDRIATNQILNYSGKILPLLEMWWDSETYQSSDTYLTGFIDTRLLLPPQLKGDYNKQRGIVALIVRFFSTDKAYELFNNVAGLIEFGTNLNAKYNKVYIRSDVAVPAIQIKIPYKIDLHQWKLKHPEIDWTADLDSPVLDINTYKITISVEDKVLINEEKLNEVNV